jgi:DNA-binding response OmpR family regulator
MAKHILIVEDDRAVRGSVARYLSGAGFRVTELPAGDRALAVMARDPVDLAIVDVMLPDTDGLELTRRIRKASDAGVIILSGCADVTDRIVGLEVGADDYLAKPFELRELVARVRSLLRRSVVRDRSESPPAAGRVIAFAGFTLDLAARSLSDARGEAIHLTSGEFRLLEALATQPGRVLSRDRLLDLTCTNDAPAFHRSVDVCIGRLRRKLGDEPRRSRFIKTVRNGGYAFVARTETR